MIIVGIFEKMIDLFIKYIERIVLLSPEELNEFTAAFILKKVKKETIHYSARLYR